jgi:hypothetical protein
MAVIMGNHISTFQDIHLAAHDFLLEVVLGVQQQELSSEE